MIGDILMISGRVPRMRESMISGGASSGIN
jgi:hypothetical protein